MRKLWGYPAIDTGKKENKNAVARHRNTWALNLSSVLRNMARKEPIFVSVPRQFGRGSLAIRISTYLPAALFAFLCPEIKVPEVKKSE